MRHGHLLATGFRIQITSIRNFRGETWLSWIAPRSSVRARLVCRLPLALRRRECRVLLSSGDRRSSLDASISLYCWGNVCNRSELDPPRTRSFLNLAKITALNQPHVLKLHVRGGINNGLTKEEIKRVFPQAAIYCGLPAAIDSFRVAFEVIQGMDQAG